MLNTLRGAVNNIIVKTLLILVALAFAIFGVGDIIRGRNDYDLVKFANLPNITLSEFYFHKKQAIRNIEKNSKQPITEEFLKNIDLDNMVLDILIRDSLDKAWINDFNIKVSDKLVAESIKENPNFFDESNNFDVQKFKSMLANMALPEEEFFSDIKFGIGKHAVERFTKNVAFFPKMLEEIVLDFLSEKRKVQVVKVKLSEKGPLNEKYNFSDAQLNKFYDENQELFRTPELRKISYILIEKNKKDSSEEEDKKFMQQIEELEDLVAAGDSIEEIAKKYNVKLQSSSGSIEKLNSDKILGKFSEQIFSMNEKEVSYPSEINNSNAIVLFVVDSIAESKIKAFKEVKQDVTEALLKKTYSSAHIEKLNKIIEKSKESKLSDLLKDEGYSSYTIEYSRSDDGKDIPDIVLTTILNTNLEEISDLLILDDYAYIVNVTSISTDKKKKEDLRNSNIDDINRNYKNSFIDSIISYYYEKNIPDIKAGLLNSNE